MSEDRLEQNRHEQRELYGQTLQERLGGVMEAYGLSQRRLAEVLGVSAPMLSQLLSARRVKMGNPRAHERMVALESRAQEHGSSPLPVEIAAALTAEIAAQDASETTLLRARHGADAGALSEDQLVQALRAHLGAGELRAAQTLLTRDSRAPHLAELLGRALL